MEERTIIFLAPNYDLPSWGVGMIYHLASMSEHLGICATVTSFGWRKKIPKWLDVDVKFTKWSKVKKELKTSSLLIVPEIMASSEELRNVKAEKVVFVQNGFIIQKGLKINKDYQTLGFSKAIVVMDHLSEILQKFWPINTSVIPPFVPDYFFSNENSSTNKNRSEQIVLFPKSGYLEAGYMDFSIVDQILTKELRKINEQNDSNWKIVTLKNKTHREVASIFKDSQFFINTNCFESMNATVVEAMAAGCITFCYEAYGGRDFLVHNRNAFVFPNNYVYDLLDDLLQLIRSPADFALARNRIPQNGIQTARKFSRQNTLEGLTSFYKNCGII